MKFRIAPRRASSTGAAANPVADRKASEQRNTRKNSLAKSAIYNAARSTMMEPLESREMMSVSHDAGGWTVVTPAADSRVIYVSSSQGNDGNSGLAASSPVRSLAQGVSLLRNGSADQLLLKRGDTWHESFGFWKKSGRSASEPMVIASYGSGDRPVIASGTSTALSVGSVSTKTIQHLSIMGLQFWADGRDPSTPGYNKYVVPNGLQFTAGGGDILLEDCSVRDYGTNIAIQDFLGAPSDITIRRCQILDAYSATAEHSEGLFADGVHGLKLEENVFDHNGWNSRVPGAGPTVFNHDAYLTARNTNVVVTGNTFANAGSHGLQARSGGVVHGNLFLNDPIGMSYGLVNGSGEVAAGVSGEITDNVFLGGRDIAGMARGVGIEIANTRAGGNTVVSGNVFANYTDGPFAAITLGFGVGTNAWKQVGLNDLTIQNNVVWHWTGGMSISPGMSTAASGAMGLHNVVVQNNDFTQTAKPLINTGALRTVSASRPSNYPAPGRTVSTYDAALGGSGSDVSFLIKARGNNHNSWTPQYTAQSATDYVRGGFGLSATGSVTPLPTPNPTPTPTPTQTPVTKPKPGHTPTPTASGSQGSSRSVASPAVFARPPVVRSAKVHRKHKAVVITVKFSTDVGASLDNSDLGLIGANGQAVSFSVVSMKYNAKSHSAQWVLSDVAAGKYRVRLASAGVTDAAGHHLDGNRDGVEGDDFPSAKSPKLKFRAA